MADRKPLTLNGADTHMAQIFGAARTVRAAEGKQAFAEAEQAEAERAVLRAEASNRAKADFLAHINHEIRTPMSAIIGLTHILLGTKLDEQQTQCLTVLQSSATALMMMVSGQLDIDKIESRTMNLEHAPFNMSALLHQIIGIMSVKAQEKGVSLILNYEEGLDKVFIGDSGRIRQIVMNLVGNAIKFTETGGVTVSFADDGRRDEKNQTSISVTDTGIGIPENKIDIIFERFMQADSSIISKYGGTGLGLSISKALAESMGGAITVTSVVGEGSAFVLHLPLPVEHHIPDFQAASAHAR
jgi:signal transduction histidine kinase